MLSVLSTEFEKRGACPGVRLNSDASPVAALALPVQSREFHLTETQAEWSDLYQFVARDERQGFLQT